MSGQFTIAYIADILGGRLYGEGSVSVSQLATDSRTVTQTQNTMFIAIDGERHDGHRFLPDAYSRGIRIFMVSKEPEKGLYQNASFCLVKDTMLALQLLAKKKRESFQGVTCGITGSNGKTIVKEWIYQCLRESMNIVRSPKSYNSQIGVPLSAWMIDNSYNLAILEAGISEKDEMLKLEPIIAPDIGILTNLGAAHQENFKSLLEKLDEKLLLFSHCKKLIFRSDVTIEGRPISSVLNSLDCEKISWSLNGEAKYSFKIAKRTRGNTYITLSGINDVEVLFDIPFNDNASIENALHVLVFMFEMGFSNEQAAERIKMIEPVSMRLELLKGILGSVLINDSYNSDLAGLSSALNLLEQQEPSKEKVVILSDLLQSGIERSQLYREVAGLIGLNDVSLFIGIGPDLMESKVAFPSDSFFYTDAKEFLKQFNKIRFKEKAILIKGSRTFKFEQITKELQQQVHQTSLLIDLNAMIHNLNYYRSLLKPGRKLMVVVKALSYGSGSTEIASLLQFHQVDYLAVAFVDEGIALREAGIYIPIMVLNPDPSAYATMIDYRLEPEIYNMKGLEAFTEILDYLGEIDYPVHIKLDTGMHRLGFSPEESVSLSKLISSAPFRVKSIFSHLAASDEESHDSFSLQQIDIFDRVSQEISSKLVYNPLKHILNTSGIERFPEAQFDMVRIGIGLHGVYGDKDLIPVSTFVTRVSQIRKVKEGETVGYSRNGKVSNDCTIAVIPVGYADGLNRKLGNGVGKVWIGGHLAPVVGNICMDMTLIDVTGLSVQEGDEVELFGKNQSVSELANQLDTIPYEILTGIPERVKRIYTQE